MRGTGIALLGLLACGCVTKELWKPRASSRHPRLVGEAECDLDLAAPTPERRTLLFAVEAPEKPPTRMRKELGRGRTWLLLHDPFSLSFAGRDLIENRTPFRTEHVTVNFAQTSTPDGTRRDPALLRIEGPLPPDLAARVEPCPEPAERRTLDEVEPSDLRVQLGHGIDAIVAMTQGLMPADVVAWAGVEGPAADWRVALGKAREQGSLAPLEPCRVIVRRWREGKTSCFRVSLADVVLASHMSFDNGRWTWEGLWIGALEVPTGPVAHAAEVPSRLHYKEYKLEKKYGGAGALWRTLVTPLALTADYGIGSIDAWLDGDDCDLRPPSR